MYKHLNEEIKLAAGCLSTVNFLSRKNGWQAPGLSVDEFCKRREVSVDTADRARDLILGSAPMILGRKSDWKEEPETTQPEIMALVDYLYKQGVRWDEQARISEIPDEARCRIVLVAQRMKKEGMPYEEFCRSLGINRRTFHRLRKGYDAADELGGLSRKSRRPHIPAQETPKDLVDLICTQWQLQRNLRTQLKLTEFGCWFNDRFKQEIQRLTGKDPRCSTRDSISLKTIGKHLKQRGLYDPCGKEHYEGKRGNYDIFGPLFQGAMDTTTVGFFGKVFKWINFFDIGSRTTITEKVCESENGRFVAEVYREARQKCPEIVGSVNDRGKVYVCGTLREAIQADKEATGFLRVHGRPARPQDDAHLERYHRTMKGLLKSIEQMVQPLCEELDGVLTPLEGRTRRLIWRIVVAMILRAGVFFYNRTKQEYIDGLTPLERLELPPKVSREEAREALRQRAERNMPKKDFVEELINELGFRRPSGEKQLRKLRTIRMEALRETGNRLRQIRETPRVDERRDNFNYFIGMANGIANDIRERESKQKAAEARQKREIQQRRREQETLDREREFREKFPEKILVTDLGGFLEVLDQLHVEPGHWSCGLMRGQISRRLRSLASKFDGLFDIEVERTLDEMKTLNGSDQAKELLSAFVRRTARSVLEDGPPAQPSPGMAPG